MRGNHRERLTEPRLIPTARILRDQPFAYLPRKSDGKARLQNVRRIMDVVFDAVDTQA
jgi:hypothetical protein